MSDSKCAFLTTKAACKINILNKEIGEAYKYIDKRDNEISEQILNRNIGFKTHLIVSYQDTFTINDDIHDGHTIDLNDSDISNSKPYFYVVLIALNNMSLPLNNLTVILPEINNLVLGSQITVKLSRFGLNFPPNINDNIYQASTNQQIFINNNLVNTSPLVDYNVHYFYAAKIKNNFVWVRNSFN